jgi:hypothetical protein
MDKNQTSQGAHASVLSTGNRPRFWARFFLLVMFLALSLPSLQPRASAQAVDQTLRLAKAGTTSYQSQTSARTADQILLEGKASTTSRQARASARSCPVCQQALVECVANGGGGDCYVQYYACIGSCL